MKKIASIISVGSWNPKIFTPEWVSANVFEMPEGDSMDIRLNDRQMTLTYIWKGIMFSMTDKGIELKTEACDKQTLRLMDHIYKHLMDILPYTPITAFGYNLNLSLTQEEYEKTKASRIISMQAFDIYKETSHSFTAIKDRVMRTFEIRQVLSGAEIKCNFHYLNKDLLPIEGTAFDIIVSEFKHFLGYELDL